MYIPMGLIWFILGFFFFPVVAYIVYRVKGWDKEDEEREKIDKE